MRAPASEIVREAADAWLAGVRSGLIRPRGGEPYKPNAIRSYDIGLRLRALPALGARRLCDVTRVDRKT